MFRSCPQDLLWLLLRECYLRAAGSSFPVVLLRLGFAFPVAAPNPSFQSPSAAPGGLAPDPGLAFGNGREGQHQLPGEPPRTGVPVFRISHFGEAAVPGRLLRLGKRGPGRSQRREHPAAPLSGKGCGPEKTVPLCTPPLASRPVQGFLWRAALRWVRFTALGFS